MKKTKLVYILELIYNITMLFSRYPGRENNGLKRDLLNFYDLVQYKEYKNNCLQLSII